MPVHAPAESPATGAQVALMALNHRRQTQIGHDLQRRSGQRAAGDYADQRLGRRTELLPEGPADAGHDDPDR